MDDMGQAFSCQLFCCREWCSTKEKYLFALLGMFVSPWELKKNPSPTSIGSYALAWHRDRHAEH